nr:uncharacterized protein LOC121828173 [Peromyscus maniculatus bairdii]XP_042130263.1 uncharacterized protein LOC121828173 [Peromyscus maniculatus bairdii]XP_042130264.1 uncharacterized protein LOC121828173 [Peromyscus maniculatus bairdii]XP_042130265.1 uncharacterized protein LOC121828173 [Peromyscus maniculatus bairdii]XP_042130266.1 uncharacterized protein LOC121828173 [Peromyscus maniculatus bairdii]XP_042130267.1 uncharacterized protein LOC121828173 [Peromyscus maniculatus bairdii]XP_04
MILPISRTDTLCLPKENQALHSDSSSSSFLLINGSVVSLRSYLGWHCGLCWQREHHTEVSGADRMGLMGTASACPLHVLTLLDGSTNECSVHGDEEGFLEAEVSGGRELPRHGCGSSSLSTALSSLDLTMHASIFVQRNIWALGSASPDRTLHQENSESRRKGMEDQHWWSLTQRERLIPLILPELSAFLFYTLNETTFNFEEN